jgi:hypothetical protein
MNLFNQKRVAYVKFGAAVSDGMNSYINYRTDLLVSARKGGTGQSLSEQELLLEKQKFLKVLSNTQNDLEKARVAEVVIGTNEANSLRDL